jgi:hypothetical protein
MHCCVVRHSLHPMICLTFYLTLSFHLQTLNCLSYSLGYHRFLVQWKWHLHLLLQCGTPFSRHFCDFKHADLWQDDKLCTDNARNFQDFISKGPKCILQKNKSKISVDLIRLVHCLTFVNTVMNMHGPYNAGNSERQAAPESEIWPTEILFLCNDNGLLQGRRNLGRLNSVRWRPIFVGS